MESPSKMLEQFKVTNSNNKFCIAKSNSDKDGFFKLLFHKVLTKLKV